MALTYEDIKDEFISLVNSDKQVTKIYAQIRSGDATYATANRLAIRRGMNFFMLSWFYFLLDVQLIVCQYLLQ